MVHIDSQSKRFQNAIRFFTYGVMTTAIVGISAIVLLLALGYRFTLHGDVVRDGLVQLATHPEDARYTVDGKSYKSPTPAKLNLRAGTYMVGLNLDGYRPWQKQLNVIAGHVHWINYPRLVPNKLTAKNVKTYPSAVFAVASPDKRWLLLDTGQEPKNRLLLVDLKDPKKTEQLNLTIPEDQLTKKDADMGAFSFVEWSLDSKQFLLKHTVGDTTEFLRVDRTKPQTTVNLNKAFQLQIDDIHFSGDDNNIVFARTGDVLRRFNITGNSTTGALMSGVKDFELYGGDTIIFDRIVSSQEADQQDQTTQEVGLRVKDKDYVLQNLPATDDVTAVYNEYDHHSYFAVANRSKKQIIIYQDPLNQSDGHVSPFADIENMAPKFMRFNSNGRFLLLQQDNSFVVYDFYENQQFNYQIPRINGAVPAKWLDDYHVQSIIDGKLAMWDFDGTNTQQLTPSLGMLDPVLDENNDVLYTFAASKDSQKKDVTALTQANMKVSK